MNTETRHKLRALVLATVMTLSVVGGGVAFIGGVSAAQYGLTATDGAGGDSSFLFTNASGQLPEGTESGDSQLTVKANDSLPGAFELTLTLDPSSDVTFDSTQNETDVNVVVFSEGGSPQDAGNSSVTSINDKTVEIQAQYGLSSGSPGGVNITGLQFDTGSAENATLTWEIRQDTASYTLEVGALPTTLEAVDDQNGVGADITAGSADEQMTGVSGGTSPRLNATDPTEFPSTFTATLHTSDAGITFNTDNASVSASSSYGSTNVTDVTPTQIKVRVTGFDGSSGGSTFESNYVLQLDGVRYDVTPDATRENITWNVLGKSADYPLFPERLDAEFSGSTTFARGATQKPDGGLGIVINATDKRTSGLQAGGDNITLTIPENVTGLSFDRTAEVSGEVETNDGNPLTGNPQITAINVSDQRVEFTVPATVDSGERVTLSGIRFNTTGYDERTATSNVSIDSGLDVAYTPVNATGPVGIATANRNVSARAPNVTATGPSPLSTNATGQNTSVSVNITDTVGGQIAAGSDIVIEINGSTNVTFNQSQDITVDAPSDQTFYANPNDVTINDQSITLNVKELYGNSTEGDWINISSQSGGLMFDTTNLTTSNVSLAVTTIPASDGDQNAVTQTTDTALTGCDSLLSAVDFDDDGVIGDFDLLDATDLWRSQDPVPGTCGKTIGDFDLLDITDEWRSDQNTEESS